MSHTTPFAPGQPGGFDVLGCELGQGGGTQRRAQEAEDAALRDHHRQHDVLQHGEIGDDLRDLKAARQPQPRPRSHVQRVDALPHEANGAAVGADLAHDLLDQGRFARAIRADQGVDLSGQQGQADAIGGLQRAEAFAQIGQFKDRLSHGVSRAGSGR